MKGPKFRVFYSPDADGLTVGTLRSEISIIASSHHRIIASSHHRIISVAEACCLCARVTTLSVLPSHLKPCMVPSLGPFRMTTTNFR
ncbi:hypothetical protein ALP38_200026 [Pseudomonas amygdali pv. sesami]|nr:hypothetical protein ALP38_200026 [Pseudomonas amygdali pv. sesami]